MKNQSFLPEKQFSDNGKLEYIRNATSICRNFTEFDLQYYMKLETEKLIKVFLILIYFFINSINK